MNLTKEQIREVFLASGFTVKEGQTDLKPYVYAAAEAMLAADRAAGAEPVARLMNRVVRALGDQDA